MNKQPNIFISIIVIIIFVVLIIVGGAWAKKHPLTPKTTTPATQNQLSQTDFSKITSPLKQIQKEGTGEGAVLGDTVSVEYVGALTNGTLFDTNVVEIAQKAGLDQTGKKYEPFSFKVGTTEVISGWNIAVTGMKKGEVSQIIIPASFAYGEQGFAGVIPPNSPLIFQIKVLDIQKAVVDPTPITAKTDTTKTAPKTTTTTKAKK